MIGKTIGRYQIIRELGKGGFATVYQGYDAALERHVAIKVLHPELTRDQAALKRFQREAVAVARLRHANIIIVFEFGEETGSAYIVMEFVEGTTLKTRLGKPLPVEESVRITCDIASARSIISSTGSGTPALIARSFGSGALTCSARVASGESPRNGTCPASISKNMIPRA